MNKVFLFFCAIFVGFGLVLGDFSAQAQSPSTFPGASVEGSSSDVWRDIRHGGQGKTSIPDKNSDYLIKDYGETWQEFRNGPVFFWGAIGFAFMALALTAFYLLRGQIKLDGEKTGRLIQRFTKIERIAHWTMATSFILLALTGINMLYGRYIVMPVIGHEAFSSVSEAGKFVHNYLAWAFMIALVMVIFFWAKDNVWDKHDLNWILKGGGIFSPGSHPPSARFNFGEKTMFWMVALGGLGLSATGLFLLFPEVTGYIEYMRLAQILHSVIALLLSIAIMGHIYIGSVGMEGAIDSMKTGYVDETWAKEHHSAWAESHGIEVDHHDDDHKKDDKHVAQGGLAE